MDRTNAFSRLVIGGIAEVVGLVLIVFLSQQGDARSIPLVALGVVIFCAGAFTSVTAALQLRNINRS